MPDIKLILVPSNQAPSARHVNQIVRRDQGNALYSAPILHTGFNTPNWSRVVQNKGAGGNADRWLETAGGLILQGNNAGVEIGRALKLDFLTPGVIPFAGAGGLVSQDPLRLTWDAIGSALHVGASAPANIIVGANKIGLFGVDGSIAHLGPLSTGLGTITTPITIWSGSATWNVGSGVAYGQTMDITDSASNLASWLADWHVNGASKWRVAKQGAMYNDLGVITDDLANYYGTVEWNNAFRTFTGIKLNVKNTASSAASVLIDLQVGGTSAPRSVFSVGPQGYVINRDPTGVCFGLLAPVAGVGFLFGSSSNDDLILMRANLPRAKIDVSGTLILNAPMTLGSTRPGADLATGLVSFDTVDHAGAVGFAALTATGYIDVQIDGVNRKLYYV